MTNLNDRRVQKTRQILQKAIVDLMAEKSFDSIKVQDILDKANVGRSTFYAHYQDKGELLHSCFEELQKIFEQHTQGISDGLRNPFEMNINADFTLKFFQFAERNHQLIKAMLKQPDLTETFQNSMFDPLNASIKRRMAREKRSTIPSELVTHYFMGAFFGALRWWINNDLPCKAEEIDRYFEQLAMPTINSVMMANHI